MDQVKRTHLAVTEFAALRQTALVSRPHHWHHTAQIVPRKAADEGDDDDDPQKHCHHRFKILMAHYLTKSRRLTPYSLCGGRTDRNVYDFAYFRCGGTAPVFGCQFTVKIYKSCGKSDARSTCVDLRTTCQRAFYWGQTHLCLCARSGCGQSPNYIHEVSTLFQSPNRGFPQIVQYSVYLST